MNSTACCIVGCGPAGAMLGLMLARRGVEVVVLEKHGDFLRDFRGDDIAPSTMEILDELGLAEDFLDLGPTRIPVIKAHTDYATMVLADLGKVRTRFPFIAVIPQWDFLDFIVEQATAYPNFRLLMNTEATGILEDDGVVTGVTYSCPDGVGEIRASLTVAADGRYSTIRDRSGLQLVDTAPPIDILIFRLDHPAEPAQPATLTVHMSEGRAMGRIDRGTYWQIACMIAKGEASAIRKAGIEDFRASVARIMPDVAEHLDALTGWDQVYELSVQANRLRRWHRPGLLCIGDAAHAMSPIGGAGINVAIQDAVSAANHLADPLLRGVVPRRALAAVQRQRSWQVRLTQSLQAKLTKSYLIAVKTNPRGLSLLLRKLGPKLVNFPGACALRSKVTAVGFRRVRVRTPKPAPAEQARADVG